MKLLCSEHIDARDWDDTVSRLGGSIFHSSIWASYSQAVDTNLSPLYIRCLDDRDIVVGAALAFAEKSNNSIRDYFSKRMLLYATPAVNNDDTVLVFFLSELERYCRAHGFVRLGISSHASPDISRHLTTGNYNLTRRFEFIIDLDQTEEQLWKGLDATLRRHINRAQRNGVTIHEFPIEESIASLEKLSREAADRILSRKGIDLRQSSTIRAKPAAIILQSGFGRCFSAVVDGEIVSSYFLTCYNDITYYNFSGANDKALSTHASKLLIWRAINIYREAGARIFNLGGCKADATDSDSSEYGLYRFKKSYGADVVECANGDKILGINKVKLINFVRSITKR